MKDPFKLYNEHLQRIREEYPILHHYGDIWAMEVYRQIKEGLITEFLQTVDAHVTMKQVQKKVGTLAHQIRQEANGSKQILIGVGIDDWDRFETMLSMVPKFGWYPAFYYANVGRKFDIDRVYELMEAGQEVVIAFEATHDVKMKTPPVLYHITSRVYADLIDKKGLAPKTHSKLSYHPERVYLIGPPDGPSGELKQIVLKMFARSLYRNMKDQIKDKTTEMVVYEIETSKVPKLQLYDDYNFSVEGASGYYTYNNIAPSSMTKAHVFDVNNM